MTSMRITFGPILEKIFRCQSCSLGFAQKTVLCRHENKHSGIVSFQCEFYSRKFQRKDSLKDHVSILNGIKPYACKQRGNKFREKGGLASHRNRLHFKL